MNYDDGQSTYEITLFDCGCDMSCKCNDWYPDDDLCGACNAKDKLVEDIVDDMRRIILNEREATECLRDHKYEDLCMLAEDLFLMTTKRGAA